MILYLLSHWQDQGKTIPYSNATSPAASGSACHWAKLTSPLCTVCAILYYPLLSRDSSYKSKHRLLPFRTLKQPCNLVIMRLSNEIMMKAGIGQISSVNTRTVAVGEVSYDKSEISCPACHICKNIYRITRIRSFTGSTVPYPYRLKICPSPILYGVARSVLHLRADSVRS
jgi:hypothetical protein